MERPTEPDASGCIRIGSLHDFVERLDEGAQARSLHQLMGQLHMAAGDRAARQRWVASVRQRFAATQAACFESELVATDGDTVLVDPPHGSAHVHALRALRSALQQVAVGEAVAYTTPPHAQAHEGRAGVTGVGVRCGPSRGLGFVLARAPDAVSDPAAVLQYVAAIAWHIRCANAAAGKLRTLARRLSPLDLLHVLPLPCVITDGAGRAIERNDSFSEFMDAAALRLLTGRLRFDDPHLQDSWQLALSEVEATAARQSLLAAAPDGRLWLLHMVPLRVALESDEAAERQMILAIAERQAAPAPGAPGQMASESTRPLTPAEQEVLDAVLQGHSAKVIAMARGASVNTVRSQITAILEKTGHHNQKALMASFAPSGFRGNGFLSGFSTVAPGRPPHPPGRRPPSKR